MPPLMTTAWTPAEHGCRRDATLRYRFDAARTWYGFSLQSKGPMGARFCARCGTNARAGSKFCAECGEPLAGAPAGDGRWRLTAAGMTVLGLFLSAGLAIWTLILLPARTRPVGGPRAAQTPAAEASRELPQGHPNVPIALPAEVKTFIADLAAKAKEKPDDAETWAKLGQVEYRAAQLDPAYYAEALGAFEHVLARDPKQPDALRGAANVHYDREEHKEAIPLFERYLALRPDDPSARTDLGTMYLYAGDAARAIETYKAVIQRTPSFVQAHYNLAVTYHQQGDDAGALGELRSARNVATEDAVRGQIDEMIARLSGDKAGGGSSPFQTAVEHAFRNHPIVGSKIVRFEWSSATVGSVRLRDFPMQGMPEMVRTKFLDHLQGQLASAKRESGVAGTGELALVDDPSGRVMATVSAK